MTTEVRPQARLGLVLVLVVVVIAGLGYLGYRLLNPHGVPAGVVASVRGDGIRIVETSKETNPTDEWTNTYLLIEVDEPDPIARLESALTANGWTVRRDVAPGLLMTADRKEAGLTVVTFTEFQSDGDEVPNVLSAFNKKAANNANLLVAILMPY